MSAKTRILLVEDDHHLGYMLSEYLDMKGFEVSWAKDGKSAGTLLATSSFELCLLDLMLPDTDGFAIAGQITQAHASMPFIFLTARGLKVDKLKGFRSGCDDYITKPVDEEELVARIKAVIKRYPVASGSALLPVLRFGDCSFRVDNRRLTVKGAECTLTEREGEVLQLLAGCLNTVLPRDVALKKIWGSNDYFNRRSMDVIISRLRKRLEDDKHISIVNVHGKGYILHESLAV